MLWSLSFCYSRNNPSTVSGLLTIQGPSGGRASKIQLEFSWWPCIDALAPMADLSSQLIKTICHLSVKVLCFFFYFSIEVRIWKRWGKDFTIACQTIQTGTKPFGCPLGPLSSSSATHVLVLTCSYKTAPNQSRSTNEQRSNKWAIQTQQGKKCWHVLHQWTWKTLC